MSEYMKKKKTAQTEQTKKTEALDPRQEMTNGIPNSVLQDIFAGKKKADASMLGTSETLAPSIAAKMSRAFGMDVSGVKISRSKDMEGTGMKGLTQGNRVILSPDVDLNTLEGQAILGHELSHVHAQAQGIGGGHVGLLQDASLEHQADVEGMRAARGLSAFQQGGMETGMGMNYGFGMQGVEGLQPLTGGISASAAAPMQAFSLKPWKWFGGSKKNNRKAELNEAMKSAAQPEEQPKAQDELTRSNGLINMGIGDHGEVSTNEEELPNAEKYLKPYCGDDEELWASRYNDNFEVSDLQMRHYPKKKDRENDAKRFCKNIKKLMKDMEKKYKKSGDPQDLDELRYQAYAKMFFIIIQYGTEFSCTKELLKLLKTKYCKM